MATVIQWLLALKPSDFGYFHMNSDTSGGAGLDGSEQFVVSPSSRWGANMTLPIRTNDQVLAIRSLRSQLKGKANAIALPNFDGRRLSWPLAFQGVPIRDTNTWGIGDDGTPQRLMPDRVSTPDRLPPSERIVGIPAAWDVTGELNQDAAAHDTMCAIKMTQGALRAGQQFGVGNARLYEIGLITSVVAGVYTVEFWPPFRGTYPKGTALQFSRARCLMRAMNIDDEMKKLETVRFANLNLEFVEYF